MYEELSKKIVESVAVELNQFKFTEYFKDLSGKVNIAGVVKKTWNPFRRMFGGHGISAVVIVPESVNDRDSLNTFFQNIRQEINSRFVGFGAYKSSHSFIVLICRHDIFVKYSDIASELKDKTGLHTNIIQGVIFVDGDKFNVIGDYTRPAQHKREYDSVLSATMNALK